MPRLRKTSGKNAVKILCNKLGFSVIRQHGSHIVLKHADGRGTVVPNHAELKIGTLKGVLKLAGVKEDEFARHQ